MADIQPFPALRPRPELAAQVCELPYDVMSTEEARAIAAERPLSFLRVSKPEIDFPPEVNPCDPAVYERGRVNFEAAIRQGILRQERAPAFYLYRQIMGAHSQTGLVAVASCEDYLASVIKKHELTRPDKEDDRVRHIDILNAQTGPVFLTYRASIETDRWQEQAGEEPDTDFVGEDGVRHSAWAVRDREAIAAIRQTFAGIAALYIADGHHRSAAAARVYEKRQGQGNSGYFLSVIFPHHQMQILPYHRLVQMPAGLPRERLWSQLRSVFEEAGEGSAQPARPGEVGFYFEGRWRMLRFRPELRAEEDPAARLDVALLQKHVLDPIFGINDPRTSQAIQFVGGIRGTGELEKLVKSGRYQCAFAIHPATIEELMGIADAGGIMPPKSTWFEPKLRDAMFCHLLG